MYTAGGEKPFVFFHCICLPEQCRWVACLSGAIWRHSLWQNLLIYAAFSLGPWSQMEKKQIPLVLHDPNSRVRLGEVSEACTRLGITRSWQVTFTLEYNSLSFFLSGPKPSFLKGGAEEGVLGAAAGEIQWGVTGNNFLLRETEKAAKLPFA